MAGQEGMGQENLGVFLIKGKKIISSIKRKYKKQRSHFCLLRLIFLFPS
jgi:hypothetical protein